jgi:hypothetical protein
MVNKSLKQIPVVTLPTLSKGLTSFIKTFVDGGIKSVLNKELKGLSCDFQQNAIEMASIILQYGTQSEKETLAEIYLECNARKI